MNKIFPAACIILFAFLGSPLFGQTDDLTKDKVFFLQQAELYQRWLQNAGFSPWIRVRTLEVEPQQLALYLEFPSENTDSVAAIWARLKADYAALNTGLSLEQALFFKMLHMMEVRQSVANLQLYDTYDTRREPCFYRGIYIADGALRVDSLGCKSQKSMVGIDPASLRNNEKPATLDCSQDFRKEIVFAQIYQFAEKRFALRVCEGRAPQLSPAQIDGNTLRFEAINLCPEVLKDVPQRVVCKFLDEHDKPCDWIKSEKLAFTFVYRPLESGFRLKCQVDGKVGPGRYEEVSRGGYLDLEIDFDAYLKAYAEGFVGEFRRVVCGN